MENRAALNCTTILSLDTVRHTTPRRHSHLSTTPYASRNQKPSRKILRSSPIVIINLTISLLSIHKEVMSPARITAFQVHSLDPESPQQARARGSEAAGGANYSLMIRGQTRLHRGTSLGIKVRRYLLATSEFMNLR
jgi:hypothetical protein